MCRGNSGLCKAVIFAAGTGTRPAREVVTSLAEGEWEMQLHLMQGAQRCSMKERGEDHDPKFTMAEMNAAASHARRKGLPGKRNTSPIWLRSQEQTH